MFVSLCCMINELLARFVLVTCGFVLLPAVKYCIYYPVAHQIIFAHQIMFALHLSPIHCQLILSQKYY